MNITFLVGNGFDINLGLRTKYLDFLKVYTAQVNNEKSFSIGQKGIQKENSITISNENAIDIFKQDILENFDMWSAAEEAFGKYTTSFFNRKGNAQHFCECHEDFCVKLAEYLAEEQKHIDFASQKETLTNEFAKAISFLSLIEKFREVQRQQLRNAESAISGAYIYNFVNFNYTTTLDTFVDLIKENPKILGTRPTGGVARQNQIGQLIHVHGYINKDLVLGVNDESQIEQTALFDGYRSEYRNQLIKQKTNEMNEENTDKKTFDILKKSDLIYIYGMSIGKTDALWWQRIVQLMLQKEKLHVIIYCFERPSNQLIRRKVQTYDNEIKMQFLSFSDIDDVKKENLLDRIHITDDNIFSEIQNLAIIPDKTLYLDQHGLVTA
jgi:hypothetical protein